jgi:AcrR family transcriptional regulator
VAARAKTGVAVLYRRWPNKDELTFAAIRHFRETNPAEVPDTGSLRGELDLDKVPAAVLSMPFDLMRQDLLMTLKPLPAERITSIVDELFLPLVAAYQS